MIKSIHFIWVGSFIPMSQKQPYFQRLQNWVTLNRGWKVHLWYNSKTLDNMARYKMARLKKDYSNISYMDSNAATDMLVGLNDMFINELFVKHPNYGAASDILRVAILIKHGGLYLDTDVDPGNPLGTLVAPHGFLVNRPAGAVGAYSNDVLYAGTTGHDFFVKYRERMIRNYAVVSKKSWARDRWTNKQSKNDWTQLSTGPGCLTDVINQGYKTLGPSILFPGDRVSQTTSDCSWL
jgi:mannosyltransferase OCH1-like enzyme